jgi:hypothetical protein
MGVEVVVVEELVDMLVVAVADVDGLVVNASVVISVVVAANTSLWDVNASDAVTEVLTAVVGGATSFGATFFVAICSVDTVTVGPAVDEMFGGFDFVRVFALLKATVVRSEVEPALVALTVVRLDTELQRCPPQH